MTGQWDRFEENSKLRERVTKLEATIQYLQETIANLQRGQTENRAFTERSFAEVLQTQAELKKEVADLKIAVARHSLPTDDQNRIYHVVLAVGFTIGVLIIVLLMLWVRLGTMGVHF